MVGCRGLPSVRNTECMPTAPAPGSPENLTNLRGQLCHFTWLFTMVPDFAEPEVGRGTEEKIKKNVNHLGFASLRGSREALN